MHVFQSTFQRQQYIDDDVGGRGGGTIEDAAKRLSMSQERIRQLVDAGDLDALGVQLQDGSWDLIIPEADIQRYGAKRAPRTDDEIAASIRAALADGTLPQEQPVIAQPVIPGQAMQHQMEGASALPYRCIVCGGQPTQIRYPQARMAFHERCHRIWLEECDKIRNR